MKERKRKEEALLRGGRWFSSPRDLRWIYLFYYYLFGVSAKGSIIEARACVSSLDEGTRIIRVARCSSLEAPVARENAYSGMSGVVVVPPPSEDSSGCFACSDRSERANRSHTHTHTDTRINTYP